MATQPLAARQELLQATRRVMGARGVARPIDRLHWLTMRRGLGEVGPLAARPEAHAEDAEWLESDVLRVAGYTAFLSRMVPGETADAPQGQPWYEAVMATFPGFAEIPEWQPPKAAAMVEALARMQTLSWMQRPVVVRNMGDDGAQHAAATAPRRPLGRCLAHELRAARFAAAARARAALHHAARPTAASSTKRPHTHRASHRCTDPP